MFSGTSIIFDLDGTLVDTAPDLIHALNYVMKHDGFGAVPENLIRPQISLGARNMIRAGLKFHGAEDHKRADELFPLLIEYYRDHIAQDSRGFDGMAQALTSLKEQGAILGVCTNKTQDMAVQLLEELEYHHLFEAVAGRDRFDCYKPDPNHLLQTIELVKGQRNRAVMVGDSATDINTALNAKIPSVAVTFGYSDTPVNTLGADHVIEHYDDLLSALETILKVKPV